MPAERADIFVVIARSRRQHETRFDFRPAKFAKPGAQGGLAFGWSRAVPRRSSYRRTTVVPCL